MSIVSGPRVSNHDVLKLNSYLKFSSAADLLRHVLSKRCGSCRRDVESGIIWDAVEDLIVEYEDWRG